MIKAEDFLVMLKENKISLLTGVPCSFLSGPLSLALNDQELHLIAAPNEGSALAIASGYYLSGKRAIVYSQESGIGNLTNPLCSLNIPFKIPLKLLVTGRGYKIEDEPQHNVLGPKIKEFFSLFDIEVEELPDSLEDLKKKLCNENFCFIVKKDQIESPKEKKEIKTRINEPKIYEEKHDDLELSRLEAIKLISESFPNAAIIVTTGMASRDLFCVSDKNNNFYMQGSMGHAPAIALGLALAKPDLKIIVIDGDGALLMHMGILSTIGFYSPKNLIHILLDNEAYSTTGFQPTTSKSTKFHQVAASCNYKNTYLISKKESFLNAINLASNQEGPTFIHLKINNIESKSPRITTKYTFEEIKNNFMEFIKNAKENV